MDLYICGFCVKRKVCVRVFNWILPLYIKQCLWIQSSRFSLICVNSDSTLEGPIGLFIICNIDSTEHFNHEEDATVWLIIREGFFLWNPAPLLICLCLFVILRSFHYLLKIRSCTFCRIFSQFGVLCAAILVIYRQLINHSDLYFFQSLPLSSPSQKLI